MEQLRDAIAGTMSTPSDLDWDGARQAWNLVADQRPALVVKAGETRDIAATTRFARDSGLRVAAQSTGHGATSLGGPRRRDPAAHRPGWPACTIDAARGRREGAGRGALDAT